MTGYSDGSRYESAFSLIVIGRMGHILSLILVAVLSWPASAMAGDESVGTTSANFLKIPPEARAAAMGEAFVALSDDESSLTYNPAGSARILQDEISATHIEWFQGLHLEHLGGIFELGSFGTVGADINWLQVDSLVETERIANTSDPLQNYQVTGSFSPHDAALTFGYADPIGEHLNLGANLSIIQQNIDTSNGWGASLDLGAQWLNAFKGLDLGLLLSNLGTPISVGSTAYQLPLDFTGGLLYHMPIRLPTVLTLDVGIPVDNVIDWGLGAETWLYDTLALRLGYHGGFINALTAGAGFRLSGLQVDYAWVPYDELGETSRITASYRFGTPPIGLGLERALIGPIGDADKRDTAWLPQVKQANDVRRWTLSVIDATGRVVATQKGEGAIPSRIVYSGRDDSNLPLPDQLVTAQLEVEFEGGIISDAKGPALELDSTPPKLQFDVTPKIHVPGGAAILIPARFTMAATDKNGIGSWSMEIHKKTGELFRSYKGTGNPPAELVWDGNDDAGNPVSSGQVYICRFFAQDSLGNRNEAMPLAQIVLLREVHFSMASDALFDVGKADVKIDAYQELKLMKAKILSYVSAGGIVEIVGHTDNQPVHTSVYGSNEALSLARAQAVVKFFVTLLDMDEKMFKAVGRGDTQPMTGNDSPEGREKNRRVEIVIHGTSYQ
jgi:outer membrane protein OmpA-like peptidoglycan-associated protein